MINGSPQHHDHAHSAKGYGDGCKDERDDLCQERKPRSSGVGGGRETP